MKWYVLYVTDSLHLITEQSVMDGCKELLWVLKSCLAKGIIESYSLSVTVCHQYTVSTSSLQQSWEICLCVTLGTTASVCLKSRQISTSPTTSVYVPPSGPNRTLHLCLILMGRWMSQAVTLAVLSSILPYPIPPLYLAASCYLQHSF